MHRYIKKYMKHFIPIFIIVILFVDVIFATVHNNAYAEGLPTFQDEDLTTSEEEDQPMTEGDLPTEEEELPTEEEENPPTFEVVIDNSIRGNITITLRNSKDPTKIQTEDVVDGKATFNNFVDTRSIYDIKITGMIGYEDYRQKGLTFSDTYLSFETIDFEPLETIEVRGHIVDESDNPYSDGGTVSYTGYDNGLANLENDGSFFTTVYKDKSYEFTVIPSNEKYNYPMYLGNVNSQTDILDLNGKLSIKEFSITTNAGENGTITESEYSIPYGFSRSVSAKADQGYQIETFMIDNSPVTDAVGKVEYDISFDEINTDHIVEVTYTVKTWEIGFDFGENGKLFQEENEDLLVSGGYIIAKEGDNPSFTATADDNYHISSVEIDGVVQTDCLYNNDLTQYSYVFSHINNDHSITITFAINTYDINIITGENGSVLVGDSSAGTTKNIIHGENLTLILVPDEEYDVEEISLDGEVVNNFDFIDDNSTYKYVLPVTEEHSITIKFSRIETIDDDLTCYKLMATNLISGYPKVVDKTQVYNFLNGDSKVILTPQSPYTKIRINGERNFLSSYSEIDISDSKKISKIEVYNPSKRLGSRWVDINILDIQIIMDKTDPCVVDIPAMEWTNHDYIVNGIVTDEDSETNPSSGLSRVVWSNMRLSKTQVLEEETNTVPISNGTYTFTCTGEHNNERYYVYAVDNANNVSDPKTVDIKIDMTKPEITEFTFGKLESRVDSQNINFLSYGTFFNNTIEVEVSAKDEGVSSGLKEITIYSDGNAIETKPVVGASAKFNLEIDYFSGNEITASIKDVAGNESEGKTKPSDVVTNANSDKVCIKNEKPIISIEPKSSAGYVKEEKQWYNGNVGFDIKVTTESGGIYAICIKINGQEITTDENKKKIDANYYVSQTLQEIFNVNTDTQPLDGENTIEVTAVNNYGNKQTITEKVYIDTTKPKIIGFNIDKLNSDMNSILLNYLSFGNFFNDQVKITVIADDQYGASSGIETITLYANGNPVDGFAKTGMAIGDGKSQAEFILPKEIASNSNILKAELTAIATDNVKNSSISTTPSNVNPDIKSNLLVIETINPTIEFSVPQAIYTDKDDKKCYNNDVMLAIQAKDADSGIRSVQISINGAELQKDMNGKEVNAYFSNTETHEEVFQINTSQGIRADNGSYVIEVTVVDNAGNKCVSSETVYKDTDRPNITGITFVPSTSDGISDTSEFIDELEYGFFFKEEFTAVVHVSDKEPSSGLNRIEYHLISYQNGKKTGEKNGQEVIVDGMATITVPKGFKGQIILEAFDNTKNSSMEVTSKAFVSDDSNPEISIVNNNDTSYTDADGNKLYVSDMSFTVSLTDNLSGIKEIGYSKQSEKESLERKVITLNNSGYKVGDDIGDGWVISEMDCNIITKVSKIFKLKSEDNDIVLEFDVTDNCNNKKANVKTEKITIDKTAPKINVVFRKDTSKNSYYYNSNRIADITVLERNFDEDLIKTIIQNTYGKVPNVSFKKVSNIKHVGVINFDEGDYTLDVKGKDLGDHSAIVSYSGGNEKLFYVDKTKPITSENFSTFSSSKTNNSFNKDKTVSIEVTEHNFDPQLIHLTIKRKTAGSSHTGEGFTDVSNIASISKWISSGDKHKLSFTISEDGVYQVELKTSDLAENSQDTCSTVVFEIDKTVPVVNARNDNFVASDDTEFLDIYPYSRKDESAPSIEFEDLNFDHLEYVLTTFVPDYTGSEGQTIVKPARTYVKEDKNKTGITIEEKFTLPSFDKDGVYALEITAVDVAGNKSIVNRSTYARLVDCDVLAYIMDSNLINKTGLYSFQYENGDAISKRPDDFSDINILVFAKKKSNTQIVLRDNNELEINTNATVSADNSLYGIGIYRYSLQANYFKDNFQNDTNMELHLTVKNEDERVDLGKMHIDNIMPTCEIPKEFKSWHWYYGEFDRTITLTNISEPIDTDICKVYDNGKEIPFTYISKNNSLEFTLTKGWHNVGVIINDMAGNATNISEREYMYIGYFWLWLVATLSGITLTTIFIIVLRNIRKKRRIESE
jgi:hypothetical protein